MIPEKRYQLRHAAGVYWLLDMEQAGVPYKPPIPINEIGARIWELLFRGEEKAKIAEILADEYQVDIGTISEDVDAFVKQLQEFGVL